MFFTPFLSQRKIPIFAVGSFEESPELCTVLTNQNIVSSSIKESSDEVNAVIDQCLKINRKYQ